MANGPCYLHLSSLHEESFSHSLLTKTQIISIFSERISEKPAHNDDQTLQLWFTLEKAIIGRVFCTSKKCAARLSCLEMLASFYKWSILQIPEFASLSNHTKHCLKLCWALLPIAKVLKFIQYSFCRLYYCTQAYFSNHKRFGWVSWPFDWPESAVGCPNCQAWNIGARWPWVCISIGFAMIEKVRPEVVCCSCPQRISPFLRFWVRNS